MADPVSQRELRVATALADALADILRLDGELRASLSREAATKKDAERYRAIRPHLYLSSGGGEMNVGSELSDVTSQPEVRGATVESALDAWLSHSRRTAE